MTQREIDFNKNFFAILNNAKTSAWTHGFWQKILSRPNLGEFEITNTTTADQKRPDGMFQMGDMAVFIENKTISSTSDGQLVNYARALAEEYDQKEKYLLLFAPLYNRTRDEIKNLQGSPYASSIMFKHFLWDELVAIAKSCHAPATFIALLNEHSKQTVFDLFDNLIKPIFDKMVVDGRLILKSIAKRSEKGDTAYYQYHYFMPGTKDRIRVGFDGNKISQFTIAWYSIDFHGKSMTMGNKLKSSVNNDPLLLKKLEPINQIRRDYPMADFYERDMLSPKEIYAWHNHLLNDIQIMHNQILKITKS